ncbi:hypothetical protein [Georgenia sp. MJ170]|uniref:hypothetical protein n=1 Tax=Georgenia sunbinii TaxID=3117728 RepID=UPI002F264F85
MSVETARLAAARQALSRAEDAAGLRTRLAPLPRPQDDDAAAPAAVVVPAEGVTVPGGGTSTDLLPVPAALATLFPGEGLRRGSVVQVARSTSVLLALTAAAAQDGGWTALTALPDVGLQAAAEAGLALGRSVVVPRPGPEAAAVLGALVDGFDVLVVGPCRALGDRDRRLLSARLRTRGAVLLSTAPWPGSDLVLRAEQGRPQGVGAGWGAVAGQEMTVSATGRGQVTEVRVRVGARGLVAAGPTPQAGRPPLRAVS